MNNKRERKSNRTLDRVATVRVGDKLESVEPLANSESVDVSTADKSSNWYLALGPFDWATLRTMYEQFENNQEEKYRVHVLKREQHHFEIAPTIGTSDETIPVSLSSIEEQIQGPPPLPDPHEAPTKKVRLSFNTLQQECSSDDASEQGRVEIQQAYNRAEETDRTVTYANETTQPTVVVRSTKSTNSKHKDASVTFSVQIEPTGVHSAKTADKSAAFNIQIDGSKIDVTKAKESSSSVNLLIEPTKVNRRRAQDGSVIIDLRSDRRANLEAMITIQSQHNFWTGLTKDISSGGLFVATYTMLPLGSQVDVAFSLPDIGPKVMIPAKVQWLRLYREDSDLMPGMGLKFEQLSGVTQKRIEAFVKKRETMFFEE
ncbi:MAG: PilZ domain-containing protein [Proteobacteria bacterium]|nr:PilZ domain-containing protein [Pseudomonadota bacterium]